MGTASNGRHGQEAPGHDDLAGRYGDWVERMVLSGETRDEVMQRLAVNGVVGEVAERLYAAGWRERIRTLRGRCLRQLGLGLGLVVLAAVVFCSCWFGLGFIPELLLYFCLLGFGAGLWKIAAGTAGWLMAAGRRGSLADED